MKELVKSLGMLIILIAVGILIYYFINNIINNSLLALSGLLLVGGLVVHIALNRGLDNI